MAPHKALVVMMVFGLAILWKFGPHQDIVIRQDSLKHFVGSAECNITQPYIFYESTEPETEKEVCKNRSALLEALSNGERREYDAPYVGRGCTYKWLPTSRICSILERFGSISFVGDEVIQNIYTAFNILLREDLALGGVQKWSMDELDLQTCRCNGQFVNKNCLKHTVKSSKEVKENVPGEWAGIYTGCGRIPHAYIPVDSVPASEDSQSIFRELNYFQPNPWKPSPVIFSYNQEPNLDIETATNALKEWAARAAGAQRNIPILYLGPHGFGRPQEKASYNEDQPAIWQYHELMKEVAKSKHFEVLGLYNLTVMAAPVKGAFYNDRVALVEAMMIINWLSLLETSPG